MTNMVDMAGTYSNRTDILQDIAELRRRIELSGPRRPRPPQPVSSGGPKKHLGPDEVTALVAKYVAGASMPQLMAEHHIAKRTVAKMLRDQGVEVRPRGGQTR